MHRRSAADSISAAPGAHTATVMGPRLALAFGLMLSAAASMAGAEEPGILGTSDTVRDFMIQNVCLDNAGAVVAGMSPLDTGCKQQRDLKLGEPLPYHKHDHPSPAQRGELPEGYQRHDSFPVESAGTAELVEHSFDFGPGEGRRFGVFDLGSDGGDLAVLSPGMASMGVTEDSGGGFTLFVGECNGPITMPALTHSWIIAQYDPARPRPFEGETVARLKDVHAGENATCPVRFNGAYTSWRVLPFRYRAGEGQGQPVTLNTLISDHYGGAAPASADHVERFYFTRELGGTRWERWQNVKGNVFAGPEKIAEMARSFAATGRCSAAPPPTGGAVMVLIDCREWTQTVAPADPSGDPPGFFARALRARADLPRFLEGPK